MSTLPIEHKPLALEFKGRASQKSFDFKQIKREGDIAIYEKKDGEMVYHEVIVVQKHNGRTMPGGVVVEPSEFYPSDNMFGLYGWCFRADYQERVNNKFNELVKRKNEN